MLPLSGVSVRILGGSKKQLKHTVYFKRILGRAQWFIKLLQGLENQIQN